MNERPTREATLVDITCDSDGQINKFIDLRDVRDTLPLHPLNSNGNGQHEPYYLGFFLMGAYQDIMGDLHNLFGRVNEVHVFLDPDEPAGYYVEEIIEGNTIVQALGSVQYDENELKRQMKAQIDEAIKSDRMKPSEAMRLLDEYERGLKEYTYLTILIAMSETCSQAELMRSLGRLVRGLSLLFWGLPLTLLVCVRTAMSEWLRATSKCSRQSFRCACSITACFCSAISKSRNASGGTRWIAPNFWRWSISAFHPLFIGGTRFPRSPFTFWPWASLMLSGLIFLFNLNHVLQRLAAMLPGRNLAHGDAVLRRDEFESALRNPRNRGALLHPATNQQSAELADRFSEDPGHLTQLAADLHDPAAHRDDDDADLENQRSNLRQRLYAPALKSITVPGRSGRLRDPLRMPNHLHPKIFQLYDFNVAIGETNIRGAWQSVFRIKFLGACLTLRRAAESRCGKDLRLRIRRRCTN